ncbi:hypothetical protein N9K29_04180 [Candidatus Pelagibacter sp.]|jgi:hypothetical protein|nr:hypothetical protein [Candidatus Pelagibacter sp.]|tara:strand:+ start:211 stop:630 length:420 start_codon:yes stop_codon:yes gene_type:complete
MEKDNRGMGDNIQYNKTLLESLSDGVHLLAKIITKTNTVADALTKSLHGKNVIERADALRHATKINQLVVNEVAPFKKVMDAILEGNDVHRAPIKTYKLDIVQTNFGQFIVDQESKQKTNIEEATQTANKELEDEDEII